jgi:phosphoglycerate dehydrogenase-like enzyme
VATAALTMILAVNHQLLAKDRLVRQSTWDTKLDLMGRGLTGKRVGVFSLGNIAVELFSLLRPFETENWATDPYRTVESAAALGVTLVDLPTLLSECDIIVVTAALTPDTFHAINADLIEGMKPHAVIINVARGPIIDVDALAAALHEHRIGGAGLDVFEVEPVPPGHPILTADRTILSPHALAWTDEMALGNGRSAIKAILDLQAGRKPAFLANPDVVRHPRLAHRL